MAEQADRVYKRKRIKSPDNPDTRYVDIPVMYQAKFRCVQAQAEDTWVFFDNSSNSSRKVRTQRVTNPDDESQYVDAERVEEWHAKIMQDQAQEQTFVLTNTDPPPIQPDGSDNPSHERKHIVRFYQDNDDGSETWCDVELIDELKIRCMTEGAQDYIWYMKHPELGDPVDDSGVSYDVTVGYCDPSLEMAPEETAIDPPYRLDIFRNIVNFSATGPSFYMRNDIAHDVATVTYNSGDNATDTGVEIVHYPDDPAPPAPILDIMTPRTDSRTTGWTVEMKSYAVDYSTEPPTIGDGPTITLSQPTQSFDDWAYAYRAPGSGPAQIFLWEPPSSGTLGGGVVTGSPLLNSHGEPIRNVVDTLKAHYKNKLIPIDGPHTYAEAAGSPSHWWTYTVALFPSDYTPVTVTNQTVTVSSDPFEFNGKWYQAKGLFPIGSSIAFTQVDIYCVRVPEPE